MQFRKREEAYIELRLFYKQITSRFTWETKTLTILDTNFGDGIIHYLPIKSYV